MKHVALALVALSVGTSAFADAQVKAFCFEKKEGNYLGLYVSNVPVGSKLLMDSKAIDNHTYHLKTYAAGTSSKGLRKLTADKTSEQTFQVPDCFLGNAQGAGCDASAQAQSQAQMQCKQAKPEMPPAKPELSAPTQYTEAVDPAPVIVVEPAKCEKGKDQAQDQAQSCDQSQAQAGPAVTDQNCASAEQAQAQVSAEQGSACAVPAAAAPEMITVRLSNHYTFGDTNFKYHPDVNLKLGEKQILNFSYRPGFLGFMHPAVAVACEVEYVGDVQ